MERISIFNYEAFYLDFLEGNLSEEDTALFLQFLEANPELRVDLDESWPVFEQEEFKLDDMSKFLMKSDLEDLPVSMDNITYFLVAYTEGILSKSKQLEIQSFVSGNAELEKELVLAQTVNFAPDKQVHFEDKSRLKRKSKVRVLWPYTSSIAAASIVLFFMSILDNKPFEIDPIRLSSLEIAKSGKRVDNVMDQSSIHNDNAARVEQPSQNTSINDNQTVNNSTGTSNDRINTLKRNPAGPIASVNNMKLEPISTPVSSQSKKVEETQDALALSPYTAMHNPIEPLTKFVSKQTNTEVEFQTSSKVEDKRRAFHLKIGKFEVSRKKGN